MALLRSILAVAAITLAEFYVTVYKVPQLIGALWTIALLGATSLLGIWLLKQQGRVAWRRFSAAVAERRMPHREVVDGGDVHITFTLTSPGCPIGPQVSEQMSEFVGELDGVERVHPHMVFNPPWTPDKMSEDAKFALGY